MFRLVSLLTVFILSSEGLCSDGLHWDSLCSESRSSEFVPKFPSCITRPTREPHSLPSHPPTPATRQKERWTLLGGQAALDGVQNVPYESDWLKLSQFSWAFCICKQNREPKWRVNMQIIYKSATCHIWKPKFFIDGTNLGGASGKFLTFKLYP